MKLSVVIPTRNEARNVVRAVRAFSGLVARGDAEVIVVDNASDDGTLRLAREAGALVFAQGPERCAQRNRGWREAKGDWVLFVDADMEVPPETQEEILAAAASGRVDALYVRETRVGRGFRTRVRNFERGFYDATAVDGLRAVRRALLARVGGYDERLTACEDWDLDRRLLSVGARTALTRGCLYHHEETLTLGALLAKKAYYAGTMDAYRAKWGAGDPVVRRQFGLGYRFFGVFAERGKWRRVVRHPILFAALLFERLLVGGVWLFRRRRQDVRGAGQKTGGT